MVNCQGPAQTQELLLSIQHFGAVSRRGKASEKWVLKWSITPPLQ